MEPNQEQKEQNEEYELVDYRKPSTTVTDKPRLTDRRNSRRFKLPSLYQVNVNQKKTRFQKIGPKTFAALSLLVLVLVLAGVVALMYFKISSNQLSNEFGTLKQQLSNLINKQFVIQPTNCTKTAESKEMQHR